MSAETSARSFIEDFHWHVGHPEMTQSEAELYDLVALRNAVSEAIAQHVRTIVAYEGVTWTAIATALALDAEGTRKRYEK